MEAANEVQRPWHGIDDGQGIDEVKVVGGNNQRARFGDVLRAFKADADQQCKHDAD